MASSDMDNNTRLMMWSFFIESIKEKPFNHEVVVDLIKKKKKKHITLKINCIKLIC